MSPWWQMGGNAVYVWPSVGLTLVVMALNMAWAKRAERRAEQQARRRAEINRKETT